MRQGLDALPGRDRLAHGFVDKPVMQPNYITAAPLEPHQLGGVAMLRRMYLGSHDSVLADDPAMGMVATVLTFLQVLIMLCPFFRAVAAHDNGVHSQRHNLFHLSLQVWHHTYTWRTLALDRSSGTVQWL